MVKSIRCSRIVTVEALIDHLVYQLNIPMNSIIYSIIDWLIDRSIGQPFSGSLCVCVCVSHCLLWCLLQWTVMLVGSWVRVRTVRSVLWACTAISQRVLTVGRARCMACTSAQPLISLPSPKTTALSVSSSYPPPHLPLAHSWLISEIQ